MNIASIDIGTNTVLLLIVKVDKISGSITPILNEYKMPRLGKGLLPGKNISADRIELLYEILSEYQQIISEHRVDAVLLSATNAFRIASNSNKIVEEIKKKFNYDVKIIDGKTEAKFAFLGALSSSAKDKSSLVIDIGGGSTELILGIYPDFNFLKSFPIGSVSATEKYFNSSPPSETAIKELDENLDEIFEEIKSLPAPDITVAIAGTPTTLTCMSKGLKDYNNSVVEGSTLTSEELLKLIKILRGLSPAQIKEAYGNVMNGREDIILAGSYILLKIMGLLSLPEVIVSSRGIRYGAIVNHLQER